MQSQSILDLRIESVYILEMLAVSHNMYGLMFGLILLDFMSSLTNTVTSIALYVNVEFIRMICLTVTVKYSLYCRDGSVNH